MATLGRWGRWRGPRRAPRTSTTSSGLWSRKTEAAEAGALGTAICAGIGTSVYSSLDDATEQIVRVLRTHAQPTESRPARGGLRDLLGPGRSPGARVAAPGVVPTFSRQLIS